MDGTITTVIRQSSLAIKVRSAPAEMTVRVPEGIARVRRALKAATIEAVGPAYTRWRTAIHQPI